VLDDGTVVAVSNVVQDITNLKRSERLQAGTNRVLGLLARGGSLAEVLTELARTVESQLRVGPSCSILLLDEEKRLRVLAAPNLPREYNEAIDGLPIGPSVGSCGSAAYRGETVIVTDISKDPLWKDYRELGARFGLRACWSVPILSESDHVLGTLAIYHTEVYEPTAAELDISMKSAALARVAIEHAKTLDTLQDREAALRQSHAKVQDLAGRLIAAQEEERRRLSRELHDGLNQHLATLSFEIGFLRSQLPEENTDMRERLRALQTRAAQAIDDARHMSRELHPASLEHLGLVSALRTHCFEIEKQEEIRVKLTLVKVPENIPREVALCLYRVAQEALRNAVKHSGAPEVRVTLTGADGSLELYVADSGSGFDRDRTEGGLGLVSMEERVRLLGGSFEMTSQPRLGTRLEARVPMSESEPLEDRSVEKHRA
jgi:signal transduction histidine kinase